MILGPLFTIIGLHGCDNRAALCLVGRPLWRMPKFQFTSLSLVKTAFRAQNKGELKSSERDKSYQEKWELRNEGLLKSEFLSLFLHYNTGHFYYYPHWGSCGSVGRAGCLVIGRSLVESRQLHAEVSLSKILNPKLLLMSIWHLAWQPPSTVYEYVCEWVNVACIVKHFELSVDWKSTIKMQDHLPLLLI